MNFIWIVNSYRAVNTRTLSAIRISKLMLYREIIAAYTEIVNNHGNKLWSECRIFLILKPGGT
jgi:hypothetical protein